MFHSDHAIAAIEVMHLTSAYMGGTDGQAGAAAIDEIEIDQLFERLPQRRSRVVTGALCSQYKSVAGDDFRKCHLASSIISAGYGRLPYLLARLRAKVARHQRRQLDVTKSQAGT